MSAPPEAAAADHAVAAADVAVALEPASARMSSKPSLITRNGLKFLIIDAPRQSNLHLYIKECKKHNVTDVVRVCDPTYGPGEFSAAGITLHELAYDDGTSPPPEIISAWLSLVEERLVARPSSPPGSIAVHCVAGLGRAPVLVAVALIEFGDMDSISAVDYIRKNRRGAINQKQLKYLDGYTKRGGGGCCSVQ